MYKKTLLALAITSSVAFVVGCNSNDSAKKGETTTSTTENTASEGTNPKGIGKYQNVELTHPLDANMVTAGENIYKVKCSSCHKTTDEKLVGPGWKGVTDRRQPEWIMNFVTNTEEMIEKDTAAQRQLEICLVKMPNQSLTETDARSILEFMRKNDGKN